MSRLTNSLAEQLPRGQALAATIFASALLVANWNLRMVSTGFVIWFLVAGVPWIIGAWVWWGALRRGEHGTVGETADRRVLDDVSHRG